MNTPINFKPDAYSDEDLLGFDKYVKTMADMIRAPDFQTPFCIGIHGKWGSGKTTFMRLLSERLVIDGAEPHIIPVWFNPWRYAKEEHLIIPFFKTLELAIDRYVISHSTLDDDLKAKLMHAAQKMGEVAAAFAYGIKADFKLGKFGFTLYVAKATERERALARERLEKAKKMSDALSSLYYDIITELKGSVSEDDFRISVFIDDLDRCLPEKAVDLMEAIKLFLDISGFLFVIGVAKDVVEKGIAYRYRYLDGNGGSEKNAPGISPEEYLDKMIQLPLELPPIEPGKKRRYIESLLGENAAYQEHADLIATGIGENPRALKRFVNLLAFTGRLADTIKDSILHDEDVHAKHKKAITDYFVPLLYIKWSIIVFKFPQVHQDIKGNRKKLIEIQAAARGKQHEDVEASEAAATREIQVDERLKKVLMKGLEFPDNDWVIDRFIHLTEATDIRLKGKEAEAGYIQTFQPGDQVKIAKGSFLYRNDEIEKFIEIDYFIDVFPKTNAQYNEFLTEGMVDPGVPIRGEDWIIPNYWGESKRTSPEEMGNHPVVLVSYEDAVAYCQWRSRKEGKEYRLPTEEEWEKAARGIDGRVYPWGDDFDKDNCNTKESEIGKTTEVTKYPGGASPNKCREMVGNVWEWTNSWYDKSKDSKVLRGGSWGSDRNGARCASRGKDRPDGRDDGLGFRCVRTLK